MQRQGHSTHASPMHAGSRVRQQRATEPLCAPTTALHGFDAAPHPLDPRFLTRTPLTPLLPPCSPPSLPPSASPPPSTVSPPPTHTHVSLLPPPSSTRTAAVRALKLPSGERHATTSHLTPLPPSHPSLACDWHSAEPPSAQVFSGGRGGERECWGGMKLSVEVGGARGGGRARPAGGPYWEPLHSTSAGDNSAGGGRARGGGGAPQSDPEPLLGSSTEPPIDLPTLCAWGVRGGGGAWAGWGGRGARVRRGARRLRHCPTPPPPTYPPPTHTYPPHQTHTQTHMPPTHPQTAHPPTLHTQTHVPPTHPQTARPPAAPPGLPGT